MQLQLSDASQDLQSRSLDHRESLLSPSYGGCIVTVAPPTTRSRACSYTREGYLPSAARTFLSELSADFSTFSSFPCKEGHCEDRTIDQGTFVEEHFLLSILHIHVSRLPSLGLYLNQPRHSSRILTRYITTDLTVPVPDPDQVPVAVFVSVHLQLQPQPPPSAAAEPSA